MSITGAEAGFAVMPQVVPASKAETGESRKSLKLQALHWPMQSHSGPKLELSRTRKTKHLKSHHFARVEPESVSPSSDPNSF